ncbi:MAG TPA: hypothetical protein VFR14_04090 [Candidatus Limnocylindrales bacterium]|nr:hypothetical protein [Candidatus Limnocylindrales bacterium]
MAAIAYTAWNPLRFYNHFVWQAEAFLDGRAEIAYPVAASDDSPGNWFFQDVLPVERPRGGEPGTGLIPFPPLPAILLVPFVAVFGLATDQQLIASVLGAIDVGLVWWLLGRLRVSESIRLATTIFFGFGTVFWYTAQLGTTWWFAHVVALAPLLLAVGLAIDGDRDSARSEDDLRDPEGTDAAGRSIRALARRPWRLLDARQVVVGFLFGLAATARLTVLFGAPFFVLVGSGGSWPRRAVSAGLGAAIPVGALLVYNYVSTGHLFHPAYEFLYRAEAFGYPTLGYHLDWAIEDPRYIPQNLAIMLFSLPVLFPDQVPSALGDYGALCVDPGAVRGIFDEACPIALPRDVGMSLLLTSPAYLLALPALRLHGRSRLVTGAVIAVLLIAVVNLMHFSQGWVQFGYRFSNDFVVFALPLVALGLALRGGVGRLGWALVAVSVAVNLWGVAWGNLLGW